MAIDRLGPATSAITALGARSALRAVRTRKDARFFDPRQEPGGPYEGEGGPHFLPLHYHGSPTFMGIFAASLAAVDSILPSDELHAVRLPDGRAALLIAAFIHRDVTFVVPQEPSVGQLLPYGEVGIFVLCTFGRPAPRSVPLLRPTVPQRWQLGGFLLHLPVTTREAMLVGRDVYNAAKFVADMDFDVTPGHRGVHLAEGGRHILSLRLDRRGQMVTDRAPFTWYCSRQERLVRVPSRALAHGQMTLGGRNGELQLGEHPVAEALRSLDVTERPFASFVYRGADLILPAPEDVGPARPYDGHRGTDEELGRFTIAYPGTGPLDQYAERASRTPATAAVDTRGRAQPTKTQKVCPAGST
jgi:hypothetical protein